MRQPGVEPGAKAWEASMLPIHHWHTLRILTGYCSILKEENIYVLKRSVLSFFFSPTTQYGS